VQIYRKGKGFLVVCGDLQEGWQLSHSFIGFGQTEANLTFGDDCMDGCLHSHVMGWDGMG